LKNMLRETACKLDAEFPKHAGDVVIDNRGGISVKRTTAKEVPASAIALQAALESRVPSRNILDILANIEHWTGFTRHFGPLSGDEPKI
ncbi:transposase, partial [Serratia marcescens]